MEEIKEKGITIEVTEIQMGKLREAKSVLGSQYETV